jgi:hypothetical protein
VKLSEVHFGEGAETSTRGACAPRTLRLRVNLDTRFGKLAGFLFHSGFQSLGLRNFLLRSKLSYILCYFHAAEVGSTQDDSLLF